MVFTTKNQSIKKRKQMTQHEKIIVYETIIEKIKKHRYENIYVCNEFEKMFPRLIIDEIKKIFNEFFLFRENDNHDWLNDQLWDEIDDCMSYSEQSHIVNKYRIFILQLCIEMCK